MSVSSEIDRIESEVTSQTSLISQIATALEGKAAGGDSGGGSVKTCTIRIINNIVDLNHSIYRVGYSSVDDNGDVSCNFMDVSNNPPAEITLDNVLCGSYFTVDNFGYYYAGYSFSGGVSDLDFATPGSYLQAPIIEGAVGIVSIEDWK